VYFWVEGLEKNPVYRIDFLGENLSILDPFTSLLCGAADLRE
jgi:hypothetical protein